MIKLVFLFLFGTLLFVFLDITTIPNLVNAVLSYITSGSIYKGIKNVFSVIGSFLDKLIFNSEAVVYTSGGIELGSFVWIGMIVRIIFVLLIIRLLIKVVL